MEIISKEKAWTIGKSYLAQKGIQPSTATVQDLKDVRFCGYNAPRDAWIIFFPNPNFPSIGFHSSYAILISKETGDVVFDGDACDEG